MPIVIMDNCWDCETRDCVPVCPITCLFEGDGGRRVYAHPDECFECLCCYQACPREAALPECSVPAAKREWIARNRLFATAPDAVRVHASGQLRPTAFVAQARCAATAYRPDTTRPAPLPALRPGESPLLGPPP